jgi:hypothetical protein
MSKYKAFISVHSVHSSEAGGKEIAVLNLVANFGCRLLGNTKENRTKDTKSTKIFGNIGKPGGTRGQTVRMKRKGQDVRGLSLVASILLFDLASAGTGSTGPAYANQNRTVVR